MSSRPGSRKWIYQALMLGTVVHEQIDKAPDLRRQMMAMRIDRVHREFHRPVLRQYTNQTALFEIVGDQESRRQRNTDALQSGCSHCLAAIGDQIAGDPHRRRRVIPVDEMPVVPILIEYMANAIPLSEFGQLLRWSVFLEVG